MNSNNPHTPQFAGTCTVQIQNKTDGRQIQGMLAVFTESREDASKLVGVVRVLVTDGRDSFQGTIHVDEIKGERWDDNGFDVNQKIEVVTSYLLDDKENANIMVTLILDATTTIRLEMTRRTETKIKLRVCSTVLKQLQTDNTVGSILFSQELASALQQQRSQLKQLEDEKKRVQADVDIWKDTAKKQEQAFQKRSDELLGNFLTLYSATHERMKQAELRYSSSSGTARSKAEVSESTKVPTKRVPLHPDLIGVPDDHDVEMFDAETVDRLATTGRPQRVKADKTTVAAPADRKKRNYDQVMETDNDEDKPPANTRKGRSRSIKVVSTDMDKPTKKNGKKVAANPRKGKSRSASTADDADEPIEQNEEEQPRKGKRRGANKVSDDMDEPSESASTDIHQSGENEPENATSAPNENNFGSERTDDDANADEDELLRQWVRANYKRNNPDSTTSTDDAATDYAVKDMPADTSGKNESDDLDEESRSMAQWVRDNLKS